MFKKLRDEIEAVVGDDTDITRAHIQQMGYLRNVVNESKSSLIISYSGLSWLTSDAQH